MGFGGGWLFLSIFGITFHPNQLIPIRKNPRHVRNGLRRSFWGSKMSFQNGVWAVLTSRSDLSPKFLLAHGNLGYNLNRI